MNLIACEILVEMLSDYSLGTLRAEDTHVSKPMNINTVSE